MSLRFHSLACLGALLLLAGSVFAATPPQFPAEVHPAAQTPQWGVYELVFKGPAEGNPFTEVTLGATFRHGDQSQAVDGFYDGEGTYRVRFMPGQQGEWTYETTSNKPELAGKKGTFTCVKPAADMHGPVRVARTFHFAYEDGTPYRELGTTCYAWTHEPDSQEETTLATLKTAPFNKVRMCVLPTRFPSKRQLYPYESAAGGGGGGGKFDFSRFNPAFFQHLDKRVGQLRDLGVEADIILFHPYEKQTGFNSLDRTGDERYVRYLIARLGAYSNVWWSLANEFDLLRDKTDADWDQIFQVIVAHDPYGHLRSIHPCKRLYNYTQPWVTHASIQNGSAVEDFGRAVLYRDVYNKPIVFDEVRYEGDVPERWGRLTGEQMVAEFWHGMIDGTYVGHGETYRGDQHNWISNGGKLEGTSTARLAFLKKVLETAPPEGINPIDKWQNVHLGGKAGSYYLYYFGEEAPKEWVFELPKQNLKAGQKFRVEILDTWGMTVTPVYTVYTIVADNRYDYHAEGHAKVELPGKPYLALRITPAP